MKAIEYFNDYLNKNQDKTAEWRLIDTFRRMVIEVEQIAKMRNAKSDAAIRSILKEAEIKSYKFIYLVNETEPFKSEGNVKRDAFKLFIKAKIPRLANLMWNI
jgi:hypothetical protein